MLQFSRWQTILIAGSVALAALFALPNFFSEDELEGFPGFLPKGQINLGLDLQGGSYLLVGVESEKVIEDRLRGVRQEIQRELRPNRAAGRERIRVAGGPVDLDVEAGVISFRVEDPSQADEAGRRVRDVTRQGLAGVPGVGPRPYAVAIDGDLITVAMTPEARRYFKNDALTTSMTVIRRRIDPSGTKEVSIQPQGEDRIVIQVPGDDDPEALKRLLGGTGQLSFHRHDRTVDPQADLLPPGRIKVPFSETEGTAGALVLYEDPVVTGDMVQSASAGVNTDGGGFQINFSFDGRGARRFGDYTRDHIGELFAIVLDGEIISAPSIRSPITGGSGRITGSFSAEEAQRVATLIQAGALPAELQILEQRSVGPELGAESVRAGRNALIVGFIAVVIYMVLSYGRFGIYADIALIANVILIAGLLSLFGSTLTLPGIAGIVLTIGMAVDANVLIFERIREEVKAGKPPISAVETGYQRAWSAILDANVTTFLAALIMFQLGAGPVRGFAVTLAVGVATSVFTAFVLTRMVVGGWLLARRPKTITL